MVFPQILSYTPLLYDQWLPTYVNYHPRPQLQLHLGELPGGKWRQPPKNKYQISFRPLAWIGEPEVESRTQRSSPRTQKKKNPRPRTNFSRTGPLEAKDRGHNFF